MSNPIEELAQGLADRLLSAKDVLKMPAPEWLVGDVLVSDSIAVMFGKPGTFKSFLALDLACCVAGGLPWQGREVKRGPALYMAAEGRSGFSIRLEAWMEATRVHELPDFHLLGEAFPLLDSERLVPAMAQLVSTMRPRLIVVDTLARSLQGGDENSSRDMGILLASVDQLRQASGACVLLVHHTTKAGGDYRGSSALEGAADTMLHVSVEETTSTITVGCYKQKEADRFPDLSMYPREIPVRDGTLTSCVVNVSGAVRRSELKSQHEAAIVSAFLNAPPNEEWTVAELEKVVGLARASTYRALKTLEERGIVIQTGSGYRSRYALNPAQRSKMSQEISGSGPTSGNVSTTGEPSKAPRETFPRDEPPGQATLECPDE